MLKPNGIAFMNVRNIERGLALKTIQAITATSRLFYNPHKFGSTVLPRLGRAGKPDLLFFLPSKAQLYFYSAGELVYDGIACGFSIRALTGNRNTAAAPLKSEKFIPNGYCLNVVLQKQDEHLYS